MSQNSTRNDPDDDSMAEAVSTMFYFIFGGSFLGLVMILVSYQAPSPAKDILGVLGGFWVVMAFARRSNTFTLGVLIVGGLGFLAAQYALRTLAALASNGIYGQDNSGKSYFAIGNYLVFGVLWLLIGIPYRAYKYNIDQSGEGSTQRVMVRALARSAAALTGVFVLILHYGHGPLGQIDIKALIAGSVFTAFLIAPIYQVWTEKCWQRGFVGSFSLKSTMKQWRDALRGLVVDTDNYWEKYWENDFAKRDGKMPDSESTHTGERSDRRDSPGKRLEDEGTTPPHRDSSQVKKASNSNGTQKPASAQGSNGRSAVPPRRTFNRPKKRSKKRSRRR